MSDCFDHEQDAYDSQERAYNEGYQGYDSSYPRPPKYKDITILGVLAETRKAILFVEGDSLSKFWVPKAMIVGSCGKYVKVYYSYTQSLLRMTDYDKQQEIKVYEQSFSVLQSCRSRVLP